VTVQTSGRRRAVSVELFTVGWNTIEAAVALAAGAVAGSVALIGFGLDSLVEVSTALVVLWQFFGIPEEREQRALKLIGGCFFALAAYVTITSLRDLLTRSEPDASIAGIVLTAVSLVVMPLHAQARLSRVGDQRSAPDVASDPGLRPCEASQPTRRWAGGGPIHLRCSPSRSSQ
jgi:divalent metal cation (Fe/Co/Zn/Cd) transporter